MPEKPFNTNAIAEKTQHDYRVRATRLLKKCNRERRVAGLSPCAKPRQFVDWLGDLRPQLLPPSWRQYKAACVFVLGTEPWLLWPDVDLLAADAAAKRLLKLGQSPCGRRSDKTSTTKLKKVTDEDLRILEAHFEKHPSRHAAHILRFLRLNRFVGLRPCECLQATVTWDRRSDVLEFNVVNAKHDAQRAHGETRTIAIHQPTDGLVSDALEFLQFVRREFALLEGQDPSEAWATRARRMQDALRRACRKCWPKRKRHLALYSARHEAASFFKTHLAPTEVAALMGHAVDETVYRNYQRAKADSGTVAPKDAANLPRPNPEEVARVRSMAGDGLRRNARMRHGAPKL